MIVRYFMKKKYHFYNQHAIIEFNQTVWPFFFEVDNYHYFSEVEQYGTIILNVFSSEVVHNKNTI